MIDGEKNLINQAKKGESRAFGLLYDAYQPQIYRFVYIKVSNKEDAEDLTHQVFLNAWRKISDYNEQGLPFTSWLYRIARNQIIDFYRSRKEITGLEAVEENMESTISVLEETEDKLETEKLMKALKKLKPLYQDILILRFIEEKNAAEIGKAMGKTALAVRLIQHRAIKTLAKIVNDENK